MVTAACYDAATVTFCTRGATATPAPLALVHRRWITLVSLVRRQGLDHQTASSITLTTLISLVLRRLHQWRAR